MMSGIDRYMFRYKDLICYKEFYNDTLFVVTEKELQPRYIFDLGKYSIPIDCRMEACDGDWKTYNTIAAPYIRNQVIETDSLLFMPYNYWAGEKQRERHMVLYDKKQRNVFPFREVISRTTSPVLCLCVRRLLWTGTLWSLSGRPVIL